MSSSTPSVRLRSRTGLRPLNDNEPASRLFDPKEARHDRLKCMVRARVLLSDPTLIDEVISSIAPGDDGTPLGSVDLAGQPGDGDVGVDPGEHGRETQLGIVDPFGQPGVEAHPRALGPDQAAHEADAGGLQRRQVDGAAVAPPDELERRFVSCSIASPSRKASRPSLGAVMQRSRR